MKEKREQLVVRGRKGGGGFNRKNRFSIFRAHGCLQMCMFVYLFVYFRYVSALFMLNGCIYSPERKSYYICRTVISAFETVQLNNKWRGI